MPIKFVVLLPFIQFVFLFWTTVAVTAAAGALRQHDLSTRRTVTNWTMSVVCMPHLIHFEFLFTFFFGGLSLRSFSIQIGIILNGWTAMRMCQMVHFLLPNSFHSSTTCVLYTRLDTIALKSKKNTCCQSVSDACPPAERSQFIHTIANACSLYCSCSFHRLCDVVVELWAQ